VKHDKPLLATPRSTRLALTGTTAALVALGCAGAAVLVSSATPAAPSRRGVAAPPDNGVEQGTVTISAPPGAAAGSGRRPASDGTAARLPGSPTPAGGAVTGAFGPSGIGQPSAQPFGTLLRARAGGPGAAPGLGTVAGPGRIGVTGAGGKSGPGRSARTCDARCCPGRAHGTIGTDDGRRPRRAHDSTGSEHGTNGSAAGGPGQAARARIDPHPDAHPDAGRPAHLVADQDGTDQDGTDQDGTDQDGTDQDGTEHAEEAGACRAGTEEAGACRAGTEEAGACRAGTQEAGARRAGTQEAGARQASARQGSAPPQGPAPQARARPPSHAPGNGVGRHPGEAAALRRAIGCDACHTAQARSGTMRSDRPPAPPGPAHPARSSWSAPPH